MKVMIYKCEGHGIISAVKVIETNERQTLFVCPQCNGLVTCVEIKDES